MRLLLLAVVVASLLGSSGVAVGGGNDAMSFHLDKRYIGQPVDYLTWCGDCDLTDWTTQDPWVTNPGWVDGYLHGPDAGTSASDPGCMWDSDDSAHYVSTGSTFAAGATLTYRECAWAPACSTCIGSYESLDTYVVIRSPSPNLVVTVTLERSSGTFSYTVPATPGPKCATCVAWEYHGCVRGYVPTGVTPIEVPGSHGGRGRYEEVVFTVKNPTRQDAKKTGGGFGTGFRDAWYAGCATFVTG